MGILGISLIAGVSGDSLPKSIISGMLGLLMACVGMDAVTGVSRFSFGLPTLRYGIDMLPAMIALIALTQVVMKLQDFKVAGGKLEDANKIDNEGLTKKESRKILPACFRSSIIASILGAMPGVGGGVAQFLCYNEVRRTSKHPEEFGKGAIEGIAAAEASNNAVVGSAMIPLMTLGIPGDGVTALLLGAFAATGNTKELVLTAIILIFSYVLTLLDISNTPLMLGMILEAIMEQNFVTAAMSYDRDYSIFFRRPLSLGILIITVVLLTSMIRINKRIEKMNETQLQEIQAGHKEIESEEK